MRSCAATIFLCLALIASSIQAQNTNPWPSTGSVGIGTTSPTKSLDVRGGQAIVGTGNGDWGYNYGLQVKNAGGTTTSLSVWQEGIAAGHLGYFASNQTLYLVNSPATGSFTLPGNAYLALAPNGNVGVQTSSPQTAFQVGDLTSGYAESSNHGLIQLQGNADINSGVNGLEFKTSPFGSGFGWKIVSADRGNGNTPLSFAYRANSATWTELLTMRTDNGNVGIGTTAPAQKLEVAGYIQTDAGIVFPGNSTPQTTPWTGVLCGGDYAEAMNAVGAKKFYEPGDVLVLASNGKGDVAKAQEPYSTLVAGIYATKPGVVGRRESLLKDVDEVPMAMVGVVPTKVTAENGPIRLGDLLVTSSAPGFAMKGTDRGRMLGAVIGKAMGSLDAGTGVIEVLVTLQ